MESKQIESLLIRHMGVELTQGQQRAAEGLAGFLTSPLAHHCFLLTGYAGTGKTTLIAALVRTLAAARVRTVLLAPTGRAAKVLSRYAGSPAYTIHRWIYRLRPGADGLGRFELSANRAKDTLFIVDEASMLGNQTPDDSAFGTGRLLNDLVEYVGNGDGCRLLLAGDEAQLPPVGLDISPALNPRELAALGLEVQLAALPDVVRQAQESGVLRNATHLRELLEAKRIRQPSFRLAGFADIQRVSGAELLEAMESGYAAHGVEENIVLTYSNRRANRFNQGVRSRILWREEELSAGDLLMVVRNSYFWTDGVDQIPFIANGDIAQVLRVGRIHEQHGFRFAEVTLRLLDYQQQELSVRILLDTLYSEGPALCREGYKKLYEAVARDYAHETTPRRRAKRVKEDPYFNALQVKFAYAVTCHKAQGGQWKNVFIDQAYLPGGEVTRDYLRWLYTALTRATERVYLVNFPDAYFAG